MKRIDPTTQYKYTIALTHSQFSPVPSPLSHMRREEVWTNVYRARVAHAAYSACQSDTQIKSHDCTGMKGIQITDCARVQYNPGYQC